MSIVTGDRYLEYLLRFVDKQTGPLLDGTLVLKLNPVGLHYVQSRLEALQELEGLLAGAPVDYLRAYISDLGDHRALEQVRRILRLLTSLKVVSVLPPPARDPTPISLLPFGRLKVLELRGCDLSTSSARGLLELRLTLEKIIVHNSTDALRHVFASRIADINDSPLWNKLKLVSCPCNELVLMDESLQLLPAVETLDLSRNKFAKVNNLKKCTKLKHLDLGFNHLRSISSLTEIACSIVKLVLRNNALTGLHGIETLMSLEGLDISYNIISNISELEILSSFPSLQNLWLEGNPIFCAPWYRAQVFSLFAHPENLKLDEKRITTRESWKRQIVIASRLRRPAGFGFYCPAKDNDEEEGSVNTNRKKLLRLALIEDGEQSGISPRAGDHDSVSGKSEIQSREEMNVSDSDAEIVDLMNRVEFMKKEHSVLWLREFKEWLDQTSDNLVDKTKHPGLHNPDKEMYKEDRETHRPLRESPRYVSDVVHDSGEGGSTKQMESESSFGDSSIGVHAYHHFSSEMALESSIAECSGDSGTDLKTGDISLKLAQEKTSSQAQFNSDPAEKGSFLPEALASDKGVMTDSELSLMQTPGIDKMMDPNLSFSYPGSPPHYQEDILHRRHNLEEEFMLLSVESCSLASLDSDTSTSDDISCNFNGCLSGDDQFLNEEPTSRILGDHSDVHDSEDVYDDRGHEASHFGPDERTLPDSCDIQTSRAKEILDPDHICIENINHADYQNMSTTRRRRLKRRIVSLSAENDASDNKPPSLKPNGISEVSIADVANENMHESDIQKFHTYKYKNSSTETAFSHTIDDDIIKNYFHANVANASVSETCLWSIICDCLLLRQLEYKMSEAVILLSSANKVYLLLVDYTSDGSGIISEVVGSHKLEEIHEVVIGIGLQVLRICIETDITYLVLTKSVEKSRVLLTHLCDIDSIALNRKCSIMSWEKIQLELFEKHICGDSETNIFLYSMLLFSCNGNEELWLPRSLFLIEGYMILCIEDLVHFSSVDVALSSPYFSLDSCCYIGNISEMVIELRSSRCVTLTLETEKFNPERGLGNEKMLTHLNGKMVVGPYKWKLKWFSEDILSKFVALFKALHAETATRPLTVRCIS